LKANIRRAHSGDEGVLALLNSSVQEYHFRHNEAYFKPFCEKEATSFFRNLLDSDTASIWIAEDSDRPVGYILAVVSHRGESAFCHERIWMEIDQISVAMKFRGKGIGSALVATAVDFARRAGIEDIELTSWSFNKKAHEAFASMGFGPKTVRFELREH